MPVTNTSPAAETTPAAQTAPARGPKVRSRALLRASGGPRYAVAVAVDALGTGLLRPFLLLYGVAVLDLPASATGCVVMGSRVPRR